MNERREVQSEERDTPLDGLVFVLDDDISVRESLELLLKNEGWRPELFASPDDLLARGRPRTPCCLLLDLSLPGRNGLELQRELASVWPEMPIIFISGTGDIPSTVRAMKAGAIEFLTKPLSYEALAPVVRASLQRSAALLVREEESRELRTRAALLTPREREVMYLVVAGMLNKQVGSELGISEITVKAHRGSVMRKMQASSFADLIRIAGRLRSRTPRTPAKSPED